jgi:hypothetical protein
MKKQLNCSVRRGPDEAGEDRELTAFPTAQIALVLSAARRFGVPAADTGRELAELS